MSPASALNRVYAIDERRPFWKVRLTPTFTGDGRQSQLDFSIRELG